MTRSFLFVFSTILSARAAAVRNCPGDGEHLQINVKELQIQYSGFSARGTLDALVKLGLDVKTVQTATVETQKLNQYLQALATGFNSCAISKAQYNEATLRILPQTKDDISLIDSVRKEIAAGGKVTEDHFNFVIQEYLGSLKALAAVTGSKADVSRIEAEMQADFGEVDRKLNELLDRLRQDLNTPIDPHTDPKTWGQRPIDFNAYFENTTLDELASANLGEAAFDRKEYVWAIKFLDQAKSAQTTGVWTGNYPLLAGAYLLGQNDSGKFRQSLTEMIDTMRRPYTNLHSLRTINRVLVQLKEIRPSADELNQKFIDEIVLNAKTVAADISAGHQ